ncbi:hypothetical protein RB608_12675 [Nocardioides sp. LHD-245]|uniref:hypothetical protein n=1 Tax=Nocardioides sp. LHD-245 TaxID=3051387 RepID=UPI0027E0B4CE|nr:hypothetical protein [Nocardioides sp. LHD-245]
MFVPGTSPNAQLGELEGALGLFWDDQDWGIVNAEGARLHEFLQFFSERYDETWSVWTVGEYVDLVLESACDALRADPDLDVSCVDDFVRKTAGIAPDRVAYWTKRDWAITAHLRHLGVDGPDASPA